MEEKLIEFVRNNKFLYDKKSRHYKSIYARDKKFEELAGLLNLPAKKLKDRWRTLRDKFYKELKNEYKPDRSGATTPRRRWKWMDKLMFLKDVHNSNISTSGNYSANWNVSTESSASSSSSLPEVILPTSAVDSFVSELRQDMSQVVSLAKEIFAQPVQPVARNATQKFFDFLAQQTEDANLSAAEFSVLQMEILKSYNKVVHKT